MIYTAGSLSLAALEMLVHLEAVQLLNTYICIPVEFSDNLCVHLDPSSLPEDWATDPAPTSTRDIGTTWAQSVHSSVLSVPSALVPLEKNYLLNPLHPDFGKVNIGVPQKFQYDPRLIKKQ